MPAALADIVARGGTLVFGSAAACTLGTHSIPVYEVYKAGADPYWEDGLDLLGTLTGLRAVVVPHYDNAEGGRYDTRYCYLGEQRLAALERSAARTTSACSGSTSTRRCVIDVERRTARVAGSGTVTVRRRDGSRAFPAGTRLSVDDLDAMLRGTAAVQVRAAACPGRRRPRPAHGQHPAAFAAAGGRHRPCGVRDGARERGRRRVRRRGPRPRGRHRRVEHGHGPERRPRPRPADPARLVVRLGDVARVGVRDPRDLIGPYVEALLELRGRAREVRDYALSDLVRDRLVAAGVEVRDTPEGARWVLATAG